MVNQGVTESKILSLSDLKSTHVEKTGGKAANLARLIQAGFPAPEGIVVTTNAFSEYISQLPSEGYDEQIREYLLREKLSAGLLKELFKAISHFDGQKVAVRSSGVAEDLEGASFAGQYDTFLNIEGFEAIEEAIRKCWASAFSDHILKYRSENQVNAGHMAVLIQPMVSADAAGVTFTANPVTCDRNEVIVSSVRGLGERLVSGEASPDEWTVRGEIVTAVSTPEQAINESQVLKIVDLARKVEAHYGTPQDIEWAMKDGELFLLQARPITTLSYDAQHPQNMIPVEVNPPEGFWEREESHYPEPVSPATRSTFVPAINHAFKLLCDELSLLIDRIEQHEIGGWLYQRTVPLGGKDRKTPTAWLFKMLTRLVPDIKARVNGSVGAIKEDKHGKIIHSWHTEWRQTMIGQRKTLETVDLKTLSDAQLSSHLKEVHKFLKDCIDKHMLLNGAIQLIIAEYAFACRDILDWDEGKMMGMFSGLSEMSSAPSRDLAKLAEYVVSQPELLEDVNLDTSIDKLTEKYPDFNQKFEMYIKEYGCRAMRYDMTFPTVAESPNLVLRLLKDQLVQNYNPAESMYKLEKLREGLFNEAMELLKNKTQEERDRFLTILKRAKAAYPVREEHGFYDRDAPLALLRYAFLEAGSRFVNRRQINRMDDIFFLELDEVLDGLDHSHSLIDKVETRQAELNWVLANPGPASYGPEAPEPPSMDVLPKEAAFAAKAVFWSLEHAMATKLSGQVQTNAKRIQGIAASSGQYIGKVRVIRDESEFDKIQPGDVLICPITSPVWSLLFPSIGALVTDSGGILSHSAIIAREYQIPAVVATGNSTDLLKDGQLVSVNGEDGVVELVEA